MLLMFCFQSVYIHDKNHLSESCHVVTSALYFKTVIVFSNFLLSNTVQLVGGSHWLMLLILPSA